MGLKRCAQRFTIPQEKLSGGRLAEKENIQIERCRQVALWTTGVGVCWFSGSFALAALRFRPLRFSLGLGHLGGGYSEVAGALANGLAVVGNSTDGDDNDVSHAVVDATCFA